MVYEAGDISRPQVVPHALGVKAYALADSPLRRGLVPGNVSQKKYIAAMGNLAPHISTTIIQETRPKLPQREFTTQTHKSLADEVQKQKQLLLKKQPETPAQVIEKFAKVQDIGPREHPEYLLVGEGTKRNLSSATAIARALAEQPTAPTSAQPTPEHHFIFGGSLKQKKKLEKKMRQRERVMEANLYEKKQSLVDKNLAELQRLSQLQDQELGNQNPVQNPVQNPAAGKPMTFTQASDSTTHNSTSAAIFSGVAVFLGIILVLAAMKANKK